MVYGIGTRSFNRSTEHREMKRQQAEATKRYYESARVEVVIGPVCTCRSFAMPHFPEAHKKLRGDWDWRTPEERSGSEYHQERVR